MRMRQARPECRSSLARQEQCAKRTWRSRAPRERDACADLDDVKAGCHSMNRSAERRTMHTYTSTDDNVWTRRLMTVPERTCSQARTLTREHRIRHLPPKHPGPSCLLRALCISLCCSETARRRLRLIVKTATSFRSCALGFVARCRSRPRSSGRRRSRRPRLLLPRTCSRERRLGYRRKSSMRSASRSCETLHRYVRR